MVVQETITIGSRELRKTYSDNNKMIIQVETGIEYHEAIDPTTSSYTYEESEVDIPAEVMEEEIEGVA